MTCSPARLAANRLNAMKSTGPRTAEGKAKSRGNALKHGMTGEGVVLPTDEAARVDARAALLEAEMKPSGEMSRILLRRIAVCAGRLDQSDRADKAMAARRVRDALKTRDEARRDEVDRYMALLPDDPDRAVRRMMELPEGIDALIETWQLLRGRLARPFGQEWTDFESRRVDHLLGRHAGMHPPTEFDPFLRAVNGDFSGLRADQGGGLNRKKRQEWAREQLGRLMDAEVEALRELREIVDDESEAIDRAEAADRALRDTSAEGQLARKYEAAAAREMFRALKEFHAVERRAAIEAGPEPEPEVEPASAVEPTPGPEVVAARSPAPAIASRPAPAVAKLPAPTLPVETNPTGGPEMAAGGASG
jgi:hypothetical protein